MIPKVNANIGLMNIKNQFTETPPLKQMIDEEDEEDASFDQFPNDT